MGQIEIAATRKFPSFCNEGSSEQNRREAAAFLANVSHESGALVFVDEQNPPIIYCDPSSKTYPCARGKTYHGRGPLQLSWNYNYGACGHAIGKDLLNQPELVSTDSSVTFMTALWFWMTPQAPKPSCHEAIRSSGFGMTINVINGAIECGKGAPTQQALDRVNFTRSIAVCWVLNQVVTFTASLHFSCKRTVSVCAFEEAQCRGASRVPA
jgi:Chitinase class I